MSFEVVSKEIEDLREKLVAEKREIEIVDFGAGTDGKRTQAQMDKGVVIKSSTEFCGIGVKNEWAKKLYSIVENKSPETILELGTCCGLSSAYMSKAAPSASIVTLEGSPALADIAKENLKTLKCENVKVFIGRFKETLPKVLSSIKGVDFAFIDGHHDRDATIDYYRKLLPYLNPHGVLVFDDISWSEGMREAWEFISKDADAKKVVTTQKFGILYFGEEFIYYQND
ncbi:MAG: O-methyltransferase [Campylobacterales bacterium]